MPVRPSAAPALQFGLLGLAEEVLASRALEALQRVNCQFSPVQVCPVHLSKSFFLFLIYAEAPLSKRRWTSSRRGGSRLWDRLACGCHFGSALYHLRSPASLSDSMPVPALSRLTGWRKRCRQTATLRLSSPAAVIISSAWSSVCLCVRVIISD